MYGPFQVIPDMADKVCEHFTHLPRRPVQVISKEAISHVDVLIRAVTLNLSTSYLLISYQFSPIVVLIVFMLLVLLVDIVINQKCQRRSVLCVLPTAPLTDKVSSPTTSKKYCEY